MTNTCIFTSSLDDLSEGSRYRLREFIDSADTASPAQDPLFYGGRGNGEVNLLLEKDGRVVFFALGFEHIGLSRFLPGIRMLIVQNGPIAESPADLVLGLQALKDWALKGGLSEIQINPRISSDNSKVVERTCSALGFRAMTAPFPDGTIVLNVAHDMDEIFANFHQGTRYKVRRADRVGITVKRAETSTEFLRFYEIYQQRALHKGYTPIALAEFNLFSERMKAVPDRAALFYSEHESEILYGGIFLRSGRRVHFIYGATNSDRAGNLPGGYPVFRRVIEWSKEIGCTELDFGGYGPSGDPSVLRFKEGFGGVARTFVPRFTLALSPLVCRLRQVTDYVRSWSKHLAKTGGDKEKIDNSSTLPLLHKVRIGSASNILVQKAESKTSVASRLL